MYIIVVYSLVVLIWSTTPLAIQLSNLTDNFLAAVSLRMAMALCVAMPIFWLTGRRLFDQPGAWKVYLAAAIGLFPNMPVVYWSAQYISSGVMSVVFAASPFVTGLLGCWLLGEAKIRWYQLVALLLAVAGLLLVFAGQLALAPDAWKGIAGMLVSCVLFSSSAVLLKRLDIKVDAFSQTTGALMFATPGLLALWWWVGGPVEFSAPAMGAITYLALGGSLLGFTLFFYLLERLRATVVSLITLITPVVALILGVCLAGEALPASGWWGVALVMVGLALYLNVVPWRRKQPSSA